MPLSSRNAAVALTAQVLVDRLDHPELPGQPGHREPVGDREPRRVVGEHEVVVAELDRGERHLLDRGATVGPVTVRVQVAAQRGRIRRPPATSGPPVSRSSLASRSGIRPSTAASITSAVEAPMPGSSRRVPCPDPLGDLVAERQDRVRRGAERLDLVGLGPAALEEEGDPPQRADRVPRRRRPVVVGWSWVTRPLWRPQV